MASSEIFSISEAESTISPTTPVSISRISTRLVLEGSFAFAPRRFLMSNTGTIFPRRFITPSTNSGASGTWVISGPLTISFTFSIGTPKNSLSTLNPTICTTLDIRKPPWRYVFYHRDSRKSVHAGHVQVEEHAIEPPSREVPYGVADV